jgi:hypothetical protein
MIFTCWITWLEGKRIDEEVEEHDISLSTRGVSTGGGRPAEGCHETCIDVM